MRNYYFIRRKLKFFVLLRLCLFVYFLWHLSTAVKMSKCAKCNELFNKDKIVVCHICNGLYHLENCSNLSSTEQRVFDLKKKVPLLFYKCDKCSTEGGENPVINLLLDLHEKIDNMNTMKDQFVKFQDEKLPKIEEDINQLNLDTATAKSNIEVLQGKVNELQSQINDVSSSKLGDSVLVSKINSSSSNLKNHKEYSLRISKQNNIIIYNLKENVNTNGSYNLKEEIEKVDEVLAKVDIKTKFNKNNLLRIGKFNPSKMRPLLVKMNCRSDASKVISNWQALPNEINVTFDFTLDQRIKYKNLRKIASAFNSENSDENIYKVVRYNSDGEPFIIDKVKVNGSNSVSAD